LCRDIDLIVISDRLEGSSERSRGGALYKLATILRQANIAERVEVIAKAKIPIVKFVTSHGRFHVDINVNKTNGIAAGEIVKNFITEIPAIRPLTLIIKSFLNQRSMNEVYTGGIGSYSILCLVTSFLQVCFKCPTLPMNEYSVHKAFLDASQDKAFKHRSYEEPWCTSY
jgi:non-canonical poly(A) RNA polymerase PAPD5/7